MPAVHVQELIAHELAHVFQFAIGEPPSGDGTLPRGSDDAEMVADEIMEDWGFDPYAMDDWMAASSWTWPTQSQP